jgi:formate hydrogenlyase subunit 3/multisubunit Na+/H+ antiporter MnhD subunit
MSYLIAIAFLGIFAALVSALFFMLRGGAQHEDTPSKAAEQRNKRMARALAMRVAISVVLFICVLLAWKLGYIHPTGIRSGQ